MNRFVSVIILISAAYAVILMARTNSLADSKPTFTCEESTQANQTPESTALETVPVYTYKIINIFPHDNNAFTQGLTIQDGILYEGTGIRGRSSLRRVELESGKVLNILKLPDYIFGEGITVYKDKIFQLTWDSNVGFVYDKNSFTLLQKFGYSTQGWGIASNGEKLVMSDGSSTLYFLDPETLRAVERIQVCDENGPVEKLNELEYVKGEIFANVWRTDRIVRIDPDSGKVTGWINLEGLFKQEGPMKPVDVLNGIAYDSKKDRLFVTGKLWPKLFEIKLIKEDLP